jgi:hypothetical protein
VRTAEAMTPEEIEAQYAKIRSAALQFWLSIVLLCAIGTVILGLPVLFAAIALFHTAGLPFVLSYIRRWREAALRREL